MTVALRVENLHKTYPARPPVEAVRGVSFEVRQGEIVALLGPNGAGKTTTVKCILNLVRPTRGRVWVFGRDHNDLGHLYRKAAAVLEGNRNLFWRLTPRQNMEVFAAYTLLPPKLAREGIVRWLRFFGLENRNQEVRHLSRGYQQKVALAVALARDPQLLLLDEPTLGLDVEAKWELVRLIRQLARDEGKTILLTSHQMEVVEALADRVLVIQHGRILAEGTPDDLKALFRVQAYRIKVQNLQPKALESLIATWPVRPEPSPNGLTTLDVTLAEPQQVYGLLEVLRQHGAELVALQPAMPDLEAAYLQLIRGETETTTTQSKEGAL